MKRGGIQNGTPPNPQPPLCFFPRGTHFFNGAFYSTQALVPYANDFHSQNYQIIVTKYKYKYSVLSSWNNCG